MSDIQAVITDIQSLEGLNIVTFDFGGRELTMMSLDLGRQVAKGRQALLEIKPSHVAVGTRRCEHISYSNKLSCKIKRIRTGKLLCVLNLSCHNAVIESMITAKSATKMGLTEGMEVTAYIKASELAIKELIDA